MTEVWANQPFTSVVSGGSNAGSIGTVETWTVSTSGPFPGASTGVSQFHVTDVAAGATSEIIAVTNVSGNTWTVTRGAENSTPIAHQAGFGVTQVLTAGILTGWSTIQGGTLPTTNILNLEDSPSDILRGSVQSIAGDIWVLSNATYNPADQNFYRIDQTKASFGYQIQGQNNIYGETIPGANMWVAQPESYTLIRGGGSTAGSIYTQVGGWELGFTLTSQRQMTIGGGGIEIDGYGTYPYTRVAANTTGSVLSRNIGGMCWNAYTDLGGADNTGQESWYWGYVDQYSGGTVVAGSNHWTVAYMPKDSLPYSGIFDEWLTVGPTGIVEVSADPTTPLGVATKEYVDAAFTGGQAFFDGDGTTTLFLIAHGLGEIPAWENLTPLNQASLDCWATADDTFLGVNYATAPADGAFIAVAWTAYP